MQLEDTDWITSTHRGHGHFLGKGGDPNAMMAEIWGKKTGICKGMGGSMHVADLAKGILGANGIVGGGLAIALGAAFGEKLSAAGRVAVCFFGDGASSQGTFMECMNVSTLWRQPLVFVCEHNHFSEFTRAEQVTAGNIFDRAKPSECIPRSWTAMTSRRSGRPPARAIARARRGEGPCYIEAETYRIQGHMEFEKELLGGGAYRNQQEIDSWLARDPIARWGGKLLESGVATPAKLEEISTRVARAVAEAVAFFGTQRARRSGARVRSHVRRPAALARLAAGV